MALVTAVSLAVTLATAYVPSTHLPIEEYTLIQSEPSNGYNFTWGRKTIQAGETMTLVNETYITGSNNQDICWSWFVNPSWFMWPLFQIICPYQDKTEETMEGFREDQYWERASWTSVEVFKKNQTNQYYTRNAQNRYGSFVK